MAVAMLSKHKKIKLPTLGPNLSEAEAREIYRRGEEATVFALLELAQHWGASEQPPPTPATPSAMIPTFQKPAAKRGKRPGRKPGHPGAPRAERPKPTVFKEHRANMCPDCGGSLTRCRQMRTRQTVDIPAGIHVETTQHTIHRDWCQTCHQHVEAVVPDALPGSEVGNRTLVLSAWWHYGLGLTTRQIADVLNYHLGLELSRGGLTKMWRRLSGTLRPWYEQIREQALRSGVLHGDETGWRESGKTHWLWAFATVDATFYMIDRSRSASALKKFFCEEFAGTLVTDFWGPYNAVACSRRQVCLVHLLRDLKHVEQYKQPSRHWPPFAKKLRRLLGDAMRLKKNDELADESYASRRTRIDARLDELILAPWEDSQARRLIKRLRRHRGDLFTFLDHDDVPFDNNHAERSIRPAVVMRKNQYGNRSASGAETQALLMSIYRTLQQRGHDPLTIISNAIATHLQTGQLPNLPPKLAPSG